MADSWSDFEQAILEMADAIRRAQSVEYAKSTPTQVYADLVKLDKGMTQALQVLAELDLAHYEGQDLEVAPFNWPAVQAIQSGRFARQPDETDAETTYPSQLIRDLTELRDAARSAQAMFKPGRGNSGQRDEQVMRADWVGKSFVRLHRDRFGRVPPMSETGQAVDLLAKALERVEISPDRAAELAPGLMRRSIEKDAVARGARLPRPKQNRAK
jgi:hypothetical protein